MGFLNEVKTHKYRSWKCFCVALLFIAIGLHVGAFGPSLIDLAIQVDTTIDQITKIIPVRAFGNIIGSTLCGFVLVFVDIQVVLVIAMLFMTISIFFLPLCNTLFQLYLVMVINGMFSGFIENAGTCFAIHAFGKENPPFLQTIHFAFGLGSLFAPLITEPFLRKLTDFDEITSAASEISKKPTINAEPKTRNLLYAYFIIGALSTIIWLTFTITYLCKRSNKPHPTRETNEIKVIKLEDINDKNNNENSSSLEKTEILSSNSQIKAHHKIIMILLAALFTHGIYGVELAYGIMLPSYARISDLKLDEKRSSYLSSLYWCHFTFFRLFCIIMVNYISARSMLIIDLGLMVISNFVLLPLIFYKYEVLIWGASALMGIGVSSTFACLFSYLDTVIAVTSKIASIINIFAAAGEFFLPVLIGVYLKDNPNIFIYIIVLYTCLTCLVFSCSCFFEYRINRYVKK